MIVATGVEDKHIRVLHRGQRVPGNPARGAWTTSIPGLQDRQSAAAWAWRLAISRTHRPEPRRRPLAAPRRGLRGARFVVLLPFGSGRRAGKAAKRERALTHASRSGGDIERRTPSRDRRVERRRGRCAITLVTIFDLEGWRYDPTRTATPSSQRPSATKLDCLAARRATFPAALVWRCWRRSAGQKLPRADLHHLRPGRHPDGGQRHQGRRARLPGEAVRRRGR